MSATSCEHAPSPRLSGEDFQCTEDELFESFMEIVNNQSTKCSDNCPEPTGSREVDEDVDGNENYVSSDNTNKTKSQTVNNTCNDNELHLTEIHNETVSQEAAVGAQSNESLNEACRNMSIDPLSQNEHKLNREDDKMINFEEEKDSSQNQDNLSETSKDSSTEKTDVDNLGRKDEALSETTGDLYQGEPVGNLNQSEDEKSSVEIITDPSLKNELEEGATDEDKLQDIEHDIEEGIRMANQVCNEIQEILILKRMSCSSDEILSDKVLDSPENGKTTIAQDEVCNAANQQIDDVFVPKEDTSSDQEGSKGGEHIPGFLEVAQGDDSSSTSSSHHKESHHSDDIIERKKSISDSLDSSEDSLSGDTKSNGESPGNINWEILNTAFGNPDTDDDDREIYEPHGSYGGFGLALDDESEDKISDDENRKRSVSQCSTISECEFQVEYKKQHSIGSLERKKDGVLCSGYLLKLGGTGITPKNWRKRWCVLRHDRCLYYYKTSKENIPCGIVVLTNYIVSRSSEFHKKNCLKISKGGGRTYFFCAESSEDMLRWMDALRKAADVIDEGTKFEIRKEIIHNVAIPALSIKKPDCHGFLTKQGGRRHSWKRRYCVLKNGCLYYYREMADTTALGVAKLHGYKLEEMPSSGKRHGFRAVPPSSDMRTFSFVPDNEFDKKRWIPRIEQSIEDSNEETS